MKCFVSVFSLASSHFSPASFHGNWPLLDVPAAAVQCVTTTYRASRSCRNCGQRCSARWGPFARQTVSLAVSRLTSFLGEQYFRGWNCVTGTGTDCALDVLGDILRFGIVSFGGPLSRGSIERAHEPFQW